MSNKENMIYNLNRLEEETMKILERSRKTDTELIGQVLANQFVIARTLKYLIKE